MRNQGHNVARGKTIDNMEDQKIQDKKYSDRRGQFFDITRRPFRIRTPYEKNLTTPKQVGQ